MTQFMTMVAEFGLNLAIVWLIVRGIYYPQQRNKQYVFTFLAFNTVIFFVMGLLNTANISLGVGFGLFAIFSILRYRTETIPIREMTYLFVLTALSVVNSIMLNSGAYVDFAVVNLAVAGVLFALEQEWGFRYETRKRITYEHSDLIRPENWNLLLANLRERTGLPIQRVEIGRINFVRNTVELTIYYDKQKLPANAAVRFSDTASSNGDEE